MAATDQIRQMVNFILQEAHEKANEIRVKVRFRISAQRGSWVRWRGKMWGKSKSWVATKYMNGD